MTFIKSNVAYILWFFVYTFVTWLLISGGMPEKLPVVFVIYAISITIALCPIGEILLRFSESIRKLHTQEEKDYIQPLFNEVYEQAKEVHPRLNKKIKIYMTDDVFPNAYALGRKTVVVTMGAVKTFTEDELKGVIGHELGHIRYGHTKALLINVIGNAIFSLLILIFRLILILIDFLFSLLPNSAFVLQVAYKAIFLVTKFIIDILTIVFIYMGNVILSINSRTNEYQADNFAYLCGYGEEQKNALYLLQKICSTRKMSMKEKIFSTHPHIAKRIERLEMTLSEETEDLQIEAAM